MRTAIVVSSVNRSTTLHETVVALWRQMVSPVAITLSLCDTSSVLEETARLPLVRVVQGPRGLTTQRNNGWRSSGKRDSSSRNSVVAEAEYVLFLDDDVELAPNYLASMERLFNEQADIVLASGGVCAEDGPRLGRAVTRDEARTGVLRHPCEDKVVPSNGAYGCNMFVRRAVLESESFDERLPMEGWLEDYDFSVRCSRRGRVVWNHATCVAHLGVQRAQRERGFPVGYAQIANSHYLWRKGVIPSVRKLLRAFWLPALRVSLQGTLHGKPPWNKTFDYQGRLRGNARALLDAARFQLRPERILDFSQQRGEATATSEA